MKVLFEMQTGVKLTCGEKKKKDEKGRDSVLEEAGGTPEIWNLQLGRERRRLLPGRKSRSP